MISSKLKRYEIKNRGGEVMLKMKRNLRDRSTQCNVWTLYLDLNKSPIIRTFVKHVGGFELVLEIN